MALSSVDILKKVQKGLLYSTPDYGVFVTVVYKDTLDLTDVQTKNKILKICKDVSEKASSLDNQPQFANSRARVIVGFNPVHWKLWNPSLVDLEQRPQTFLIPTSTKFLETGGDLFFYIKSEDEESVKLVAECLRKELSNLDTKEVVFTPSSPSGRRILQRSFDDGILNACDAESLKVYTIIGDHSAAGKPGATYMMTQKFKFDWLILGNMWKSEKEDMIGRQMVDNCIIPSMTERSHIFRAHFIPEETPQNVINKHRVMFRQSLPYGVSSSEKGREEGVFYLSFANTTNSFTDVLESIVGNDENAATGEVTADLLMNACKPLQGTWWYVPSAEELQMETSTDRNFDLKLHWDVRSSNPYMFYNQNEYLYRMTSGGYVEPGEVPSPRVLRLIGHAFLEWNDQWFKPRKVPPIEHLEKQLTAYTHKKSAKIMASSVMIRKARAINISLSKVFTTTKEDQMDSSEFYGNQADLFNIHPDEIIVGRMPNFSLGLGKVTMPYIHDGNEKMDAFLKGLSENASIGHIIPNIGLVLEKGVQGIINDLKKRKQNTAEDAKEERDFLRGCILSWKGVRSYIQNYSALAKHLAGAQPGVHNAREYKFTKDQKANLQKIADRMTKISTDVPTTFEEAAQLVFSVHCCLHLIGEPTSIGRLDQMLEPFRGQLPDDEAQEVIDCFFVKLGERVRVNKTILVDRNTWGTCAVPFRSDGMFPNGDTINQWVQQVTVGGYKSRDKQTSACNKVTLMCLKAARRLPLNAPCVSLRVHHGMDKVYLEESAKSLLSGGAHPVILQDDRFVEGLVDVLKTYKSKVEDGELEQMNDIACDGCFEVLISGSTEFSFAYIPLLQVLEMTINQGSTYSSAGPAYLNGMPQSLPSKHPSEIETFQEVLDLFKEHFEIKTQQSLVGLLSNYGNLASVCPSPFLSTLIEGCLESKRDLTNGGAKYKMISVMHVGFSNTVDSLYAIKRLCFDQDNAMLSLSEMVTCLKNDWGYDVHEPTYDRAAGQIRKDRKTDVYQHVRDEALKFPKFGTKEAANEPAIVAIADFLANCAANTLKKLTNTEKESGSPLALLLKSLEAKYTKGEHKFEILFTPGAGTFEGYVGWGQSCGASADGRRRGNPIASDMSAAPSPQDLPPNPGNTTELYTALKNWNKPEINKGIINGAEIDMTIGEDFKKDDLVALLSKYAEEQEEMGGNILTVTCANRETYSAAVVNPEVYNLLRVRTGGWSEFFISFFKAHQDHHLRRLYYKMS